MTSETPGKNSITLFVIIHDDVPITKRETLYEDYFHHLKVELESFIERKIHIVIGNSSPPYSNFEYKGDNLKPILDRWEKLGLRYLREAKEQGFDTNPLSKVVLVTHEQLNSKTGGIALLNSYTGAGSFAIASLFSYLAPAHEIGHLLGARHEDFEVQYNGWWGETYMTPQRTSIRSISYHFSPANRQNIKNYLANRA